VVAKVEMKEKKDGILWNLERRLLPEKPIATARKLIKSGQ
jgi:hypothetical protein